jgi:hypothetical protein
MGMKNLPTPTAGFGTDSECSGTEFMFAISMEMLLGGPILLIKTAGVRTSIRPSIPSTPKCNHES